MDYVEPINQHKRIRFGVAHFGILLGFVFIGIGLYQTFAKSNSIKVNAKIPWTATGIRVKPGNILIISATGQVTASTNPNDIANKWVGPEGWGYDLQSEWLKNGKATNWVYILGRGSSLMCLVCRIDNGEPIMIGKEMRREVTTEGVLFFGVNDAIHDGDVVLTENSKEWQDNDGVFQVSVEVK